MKTIHARNVHEALPMGLALMQGEGLRRESRNGPVMQHPHPVATCYSHPDERVIFYPWRNANPFFHFYESLWMLAGRNDVEPLVRYVKRMKSFSDDGRTFNAAYGYRWRRQKVDQLPLIIKGIGANNDDRRQVLQIWTLNDLGKESVDIACNLTATFQVNIDGHLDMSVFCRSNDIIWGCYGANAVHFSMLHEYIARGAGLPIGTYTHISVNWHAYTRVLNRILERQEASLGYPDPYWNGEVCTYPLMSTCPEEWDADVQNFITKDGQAPLYDRFYDPFFTDVALPIVVAHDFYQLNIPDAALTHLEKCKASDWKRACQEWIQRRMK